MDTFRRMIVRAAPTCTLWTPDIYQQCLVFRFNSRWKISKQEFLELVN